MCVNEFIFAVASIQQMVCEFRLHHMDTPQQEVGATR